MKNLFPLVIALAGSIVLVKCHPVVLNPELVNYENLHKEDQSVLRRVIRAAPLELQVEDRLDVLNNSDEFETSELDRTRRANGGRSGHRGGHRHVGGHSHRDHISRIDGAYSGYRNDRHRSHHRRNIHRRRDDDDIFH